jgi:hypothetical protein
MAWGSPGCSTSRPNGRASAKSSVSPDNSRSIEPVSATSVSVSGKRDSESGENGARTALMDPAGCLWRPDVRANAATSALFSALGEISRFERVRGGPGSPHITPEIIIVSMS